jgi:uncharacterized repeat protein (TIGR04042 family)
MEDFMPELYFHVRWSDGATQRCYSPSTVVEDFFAPGGVYGVADFVERSRQALRIASERVREKYGITCAGASGQLAEIERVAARYDSVPGATVTVEALRHADGSDR